MESTGPSNILPNFSDKDIDILKFYFEFNKKYYDTINEEMQPDLATHPVWGPLLANMSKEQLEAQRAESQELQHAAIFEGKWKEYADNLMMQGVMYARMNISYSEWYYLIKAYREQLFPHILKDYHESREIVTYMEGMSKFLDYAMYGIAEAYFEEKNNIIKSKEALFRTIFENTVDHVMVIDKERTIVMINRSEEYPIEDVIGKNLNDFPRQESYNTVNEAIDTVLKKKKPLVYETEFVRKGEKLYFSSSLSPILDANGEVDKIVFISRDISQKKKAEIAIQEMNASLETKVSERTEELKKSNAELEQFAYVASHDLQEPLRTISNYVNLFTKKFKGSIDEESDLYLNFINGATKRMQMLIRDLLEYSRTGHDKNLSKIDCNELVHEVINDLDALAGESNSKIIVEKLPVITGYPDLSSLFQNLISNAIKFKRKDEPGIIKISAEENENEWLFKVEDNGIGIEEAHRERIFVIFQKLHNNAEYAGTGIGLAQSKKIVELHGGEIWVESIPGEGATFYFTIPKKPVA